VPVIDRVFDFAETPAALHYFREQAHFGKVCVTFP
jgi:NADPH:quinone reductase-like Zn-dependent oxidoreductase